MGRSLFQEQHLAAGFARPLGMGDEKFEASALVQATPVRDAVDEDVGVSPA